MFFMAVQVWFYPCLVFVLLTLLLLTIPKEALRLLLPFGLVLGGLVDVVSNFIFGNLFGIYRFTNPGIFNASGQMILSPLAWILVIVLFLYFWPKKYTQLVYFYVLAWGLLATGVSQVVDFLELFDYSEWFYPFPMLILFLIRFAFVAWIAKPWTNS
jgi:hypothetical protein